MSEHRPAIGTCSACQPADGMPQPLFLRWGEYLCAACCAHRDGGDRRILALPPEERSPLPPHAPRYRARPRHRERNHAFDELVVDALVSRVHLPA